MKAQPSPTKLKKSTEPKPRAKVELFNHHTGYKTSIKAFTLRVIHEFNTFSTSTTENLVKCIRYWIFENRNKYPTVHEVKWNKDEILIFFDGIKIIKITVL